MADQPPHLDKGTLAIGVVTAGAGLYFVLVGFGLLPPPSHSNAPGWVIACCGIAFFAAGSSVLVRALFGVDEPQQDLPERAPRLLRAIYNFAGVGAAAALAAVGTWVAFGAGERHFTMSGPISGPLGDGIGRAIFGIGAVLTWLAVALIARAAYRKVFGRKN
jgi:hypothetical protein